MKYNNHWAEKLQTGDRCLATIRHKTDGSKNLIDQPAIVVENNKDDSHVLVALKGEDLYVVPYNELNKEEQ